MYARGKAFWYKAWLIDSLNKHLQRIPLYAAICLSILTRFSTKVFWHCHSNHMLTCQWGQICSPRQYFWQHPLGLLMNCQIRYHIPGWCLVVCYLKTQERMSSSICELITNKDISCGSSYKNEDPRKWLNLKGKRFETLCEDTMYQIREISLFKDTENTGFVKIPVKDLFSTLQSFSPWIARLNNF